MEKDTSRERRRNARREGKEEGEAKGANGKRERPKAKKGRAASVKEKSLKKSENKGEGACLLPRWPCHWRRERQELLINAKNCGVGQ